MKFNTFLTLIIYFALLLPSPICAATNFYIEVTKTNLEIGKYTEKKFKKRPIKSYGINGIDVKYIKEILIGSDKKERVLFYFHSMWGSIQPYHKNSLKKLNESLEVDKIITIEWHAKGIKYKESWEETIQQGAQISELFEQLINNKQNEYFVLCHSMGHRIFEGVIKEISEKEDLIKSVFFAAADLDVEVFDTNLKKLPTIANQIIIYINEKDRLLKLSNKIHKRERLGLQANKYKGNYKLVPNLEIVNVTNSAERKRLSPSNHIYFKTNHAVLRDIAFIIDKNLEKRRMYYKRISSNYLALN